MRTDPRAWLVAAFIATVAGGTQGTEIAIKVTDESGAPVADAVVVAAPVDWTPKPVPSIATEVMIDQIGKEFVPHVKAIPVGASVLFPNKDNIRHHVYSFSSAKRFELPLYAGTPAKPVVFDKAGVVVLGCNIHDWMIAYIYVSESPYFTKTGNDGRAILGALPSRMYNVRVWHPQAEGSEQTTAKTIDLAGTQHADMSWAVKLKPATRVRRAPVAGAVGRY